MLLSDKQTKVLESLKELEGWEVLEMVREWSKIQITNPTFYVGIDKGQLKETGTVEFTIAMLYRILSD